MVFTCIIGIAFNAFVIEISETFTLETFVAVADLCIVIGVTFAHFYLSEQVTSDLLAIADIFYNSTWYRLPARQQKLVVLPIQRADRDLRLNGLGMFECSLSVFATV